MKPFSFLLLLTWYLFAFNPGAAQPKGAGMRVVASTERRMALVVGMNAYQYESKLKNPVNDAQDMATTLEKLGFEVTLRTDQEQSDMKRTITNFVNSLRPNDVVFFYYSGHGLGYQNENYLMPIDTRIDCLEEIPLFSFSVSYLQGLFRTRRVSNSFLILDACRSLSPNLAICQSSSTKANFVAPKGFVILTGQTGGDMIVYATEAGQVADDNIGSRNGLFTQELLKQLVVPDLTFGQILVNTTESVFSESKKMAAHDSRRTVQLPTAYGILGQKFIFLKTIRSPDAETNHKPTELEVELTRLRKENETLRTRNVEPVITTPKLEEKTINKFLDLPFAELVYVPGGSFEMGSKNGNSVEKPLHRVTLSSFYMGKYEVTVGQFGAFVDATGYKTDADKGNGSSVFSNSDKQWHNTAGINWRHNEVGGIRGISEQNHPVVHVSHNDATAFCRWLVKREGLAYRLSTESEWEYAAGGGSNSNRTVYSGTSKANKLSEYANVRASVDSYEFISPVGKKQPNQLVLYDMSGNVYEWCSDWFGTYSNANQLNPLGPASGNYRVLRGGSWSDLATRIAFRINNSPDNRTYYYGFRVVVPSE